jgi:HIT domain
MDVPDRSSCLPSACASVVFAPGHVLVIPKRMGARNLLDLKPDELRDLLVTVQKVATAQRKGFCATGFKLIQNNAKKIGVGPNFDTSARTSISTALAYLLASSFIAKFM